MIEGDKGGLIFQPNIRQGNVYENVAQLDYAQMYPSIMVLHNISPECVNCECCAHDPDVPRAPESHWHICRKRVGIVAQTLSHVLSRRKHYKAILKNGDNAEVDAKQGALKWLLVTSFGYLGYRNAKFGRLESHEAVTSYGREILLRAKELAEDMGFEFLHAITDSMFIRNYDGSPVEMVKLEELCKKIHEITNIEMAIEGVYNWVIFPPSKVDDQSSVANRYLGLFSNGKLKIRGFISRRKDMPAFIKSYQLEAMEIMQSCPSADVLRQSHGLMQRLFEAYSAQLNGGEVPWRDLLIRRTASKAADEYIVSTGTAVSLQQMKRHGIEVQAGEKVKFIVQNSRSKNTQSRYLSEEVAHAISATRAVTYDLEFYSKLLIESFEEIWRFFAPANYFSQLRRSGIQPSLFSSLDIYEPARR